MKKELNHKSGFVNIIGKPNAGKSTLINLLLGEKLSIITEKAQTTRHRIFGIYNEEDVQIVFSDTPGILEPKYMLQEKMMDSVKETFEDADAFILLVSMNDSKEMPEWVIEKLRYTTCPILILINKVDTTQPDKLEETIGFWHDLFPTAEILPISALFGFNTEHILPKLKSWLPQAPPYYGKDVFTNRPERFFVTETLREKILLNYTQEIPYAVELEVEFFNRTEKKIDIGAILYTERESQKAILLGHKRKKLNKVIAEATKDLERFFEMPIQMDVHIKIKKNWRKDDNILKKFGY